MKNSRRRWSLRLSLVPQDCWVGVYWRKHLAFDEAIGRSESTATDVWLCLVPCLPIHFRWWS